MHVRLITVDAMFLIRTLVNLTATFGGIAKIVLKRLLGIAKRVNSVCDVYKSPSIKDIEWDMRESTCTDIDFIMVLTKSIQRLSTLH